MRGSEGTGNGGRVRSAFPIPSANLLQASNPEFAGNMKWRLKVFGDVHGQYGVTPLDYDPTIAPVQPEDIPGAFLPGYGATARAHFGTPGETFLMFREGHNQSHYDMDQGSFKFYALGEQLLPNSSLGYNSQPANTQHGIISYGEPEWFNNHGRVDSTVVDYAYLSTVDYLLGRQHYDEKSKGYTTGNGGCKAPFDWYRQFLLMKSLNRDNPSYLVLRDTFRGTEFQPSHWHCWLNGKKDDITVQGNRLLAPTPQGNRLEMLFAEPTAIAPALTWKPTHGGSGGGFPDTGATQMRLTQDLPEKAISCSFTHVRPTRGPRAWNLSSPA